MNAPRVLERPLVGALLVFALACVAFAPVVLGDIGFVKLDDARYVTDNDVVRSGLNARSFRWAFTTLYFANYHPLTWLSHCLDVSLFGLDARGHHATSVLLHAIASALLVPALASITQRPIAALLAASLFAVHPQHVESVAWIAERKDVLSAVFFAAMLWAWGAAHRHARPRLRVLAFAFLLLGLLAKPMLVTVPPLLLVIDVLLLRRRVDARLFIEKIPFVGLSIVFSLIAVRAQRAEGALVTDESWTFARRCGNAFVALARYLEQTVWPVQLSPYYTVPLDGWSALRVSLSVLVVAALTVTCVVAMRARDVRAPLAGWLWFCGMLVPVLGFVKVGLQSMADRYTYLPHVGVFLLFGLALDRAAAHARASLVTTVATVAILGALILRTHDQIPVWTSPRSLWEHAVLVDPESAWVRWFAADAALADGDIDAARTHARIAARGAPHSIDILERLARVEVMAGDLAAAEAPLRFIVENDPTRDPALLLLGEVCRNTDRPDEARAFFTRAIDAAQRNGHADIAERARVALAGGALTDIGEPRAVIRDVPR